MTTTSSLANANPTLNWLAQVHTETGLRSAKRRRQLKAAAQGSCRDVGHFSFISISLFRQWSTVMKQSTAVSLQRIISPFYDAHELVDGTSLAVSRFAENVQFPRLSQLTILTTIFSLDGVSVHPKAFRAFNSDDHCREKVTYSST